MVISGSQWWSMVISTTTRTTTTTTATTTAAHTKARVAKAPSPQATKPSAVMAVTLADTIELQDALKRLESAIRQALHQRERDEDDLLDIELTIRLKTKRRRCTEKAKAAEVKTEA